MTRSVILAHTNHLGWDDALLFLLPIALAVGLVLWTAHRFGDSDSGEKRQPPDQVDP